MFRSVAAFLVYTVWTNINLSDAYEAFSPVQGSAKGYDINYNNQCGAVVIEPALPSTPTDSKSTKSLEDDFNKGNLQFTSNFFYNVVKENPGKSVTLSPYSTLFLLAELALYATGETLQQLLSALNLETQNEIKTVIPPILDSIADQKNVTLDLAERVYGNIKSTFSNSFKKDTKDIFRAEAVNINFTVAQKAADLINKWVADNTNGKIENLIPASLLTPYTELVLVNAFYFLGKWRNKFNLDNTRLQTFYMSHNKTITIDMMNQEKFFNYAQNDDLNAQAIELPYVNDNLTFLILLPNDINGVTNLVTKLINPNGLHSVRSSLQSTRINLSLPKFNTTTTTDLKYIFEKLYITDMFDLNSSGLNDILAEPKKIRISAGIQKVNIEINESGSEAAAGNAIIGVAATAAISTPPIQFIADHPFIYYLLFLGNPIFCGLFAGNS